MDLYGNDLTIVLAGVAVDHPEITDAALVRGACTTPDDTIVHLFLGDELRDPDGATPPSGHRAGDEARSSRWRNTSSSHHGQEHQAYCEHLLAIRRRSSAPRIECSRPGCPVPPIEPRVACDDPSATSSSRAGDRASLAAIDLIERTTGGIRWLSEPGVRRVILAPSYFSRPYNFLLGGLTGACSATRSPMPRSTRPTRSRRRPSVVRLHRALGDETRTPDPAAAARPGPVPDRDRPAARAVEADDQAPPGAPPLGRSRHRHRSRAPSSTTASDRRVSTTRPTEIKHFLAGLSPGLRNPCASPPPNLTTTC